MSHVSHTDEAPPPGPAAAPPPGRENNQPAPPPRTRLRKVSIPLQGAAGPPPAGP